MCGTFSDSTADCRGIQFGKGMTGLADQELAVVGGAWLDAADISVERGNPVHQPHLQEKIQGPVHSWRGRPAALLQHVEELVGADRFVLLPDQLKDAPTNGGEALLVLLTEDLGVVQGFGDAPLMIVCLVDKCLCRRSFHDGLSRLRFDLLWCYTITLCKTSANLEALVKISILLVKLILFFWAAAPLAWAGEDRGPAVVVSIKPVHALVAGVMQGVAEPQLLVKRGGSPHGYVLRPSEARALADADLVIWVGHALESFLDKPLSTLAGKSRQLILAEALAGQLLPLRAGGGWDVHGHDLETAEESEHGHAKATKPQSDETHESGSAEGNLHLWLSPLLAKQIVAQSTALLSEIDPTHQHIYRQNAAQLEARLDQLHQQLTDKLAPVRAVPFVVFHDAYQYFEVAYGLNAVGSLTVDAERKPGARRISEIRAKIKALDARCVFSEPQFESRLVATLIEGTGARSGVLDPLGSGLAEGPESYFQLMHNLADNLLLGLR